MTFCPFVERITATCLCMCPQWLACALQARCKEQMRAVGMNIYLEMFA